MQHTDEWIQARDWSGPYGHWSVDDTWMKGWLMLPTLDRRPSRLRMKTEEPCQKQCFEGYHEV